MKLHLNETEFNSYINDLIRESISEISESYDDFEDYDDFVEPDELEETRSYVRSLVEETIKNLPANLRESFFESMYEKDDSDSKGGEDPDEYFSGKDVHGKEVNKSEQAYSEDAIAMLQDPIIDRDALADEIDGLSDLAEGSARSYLSKVAAGERPLPDDMAKAIVERINSIGKTRN